MTVQLTKIHFHNQELPTISRHISAPEVGHVLVKKKFFRHRWVLKINEINGRKIQWRLVVCALVISCIVVTVCVSLYFCFGKLSNARVLTNHTTVDVVFLDRAPFANVTHENVMTPLCQNCTSGGLICLKMSENEAPQCVQPLDKKDPTGCGGFCTVDTQFCQLLDQNHGVYQCLNVKRTLKCPLHYFNCGNMCIDQNKKCDGIVHCSNKSDEENCDCDLQTHFRCGDSSCLPKSKFCDRVVDCWDKTDEINCTKDCKNGTIPCFNGGCISKEYFCDGKPDCSDRSDEPYGCQL